MATGNRAEREDLKDGDRELVRQRWRKQVHGRREGVGGGREKKKNKNHSSVGKRGIQGKAWMQKRGDGAPRARHSPQLSLSALPGDSAASDASLSCSPPLLFRTSGRLAVPHLRENVHVSQLLRDEAP